MVGSLDNILHSSGNWARKDDLKLFFIILSDSKTDPDLSI